MKNFKELDKRPTHEVEQSILDKWGGVNKILDENTIADNASSKLSSIRKAQKNLGIEIKNKLDK